MSTDTHQDRPLKRGLVLEGGGGKGAYQIGALQALRECGINFHCVAGTSVGALNAVLFAGGRLKEARNFWSEISPGKVRKWRRPAFIFLALEGLYALSRIISVPAVGLMGSRENRIRNFWKIGPTFILGVIAIHFLSKPDDNLGIGAKFLMAAFVAYSFLLVLPLVLEKLNISLFSTHPLRNALERHLDGIELRVPVYVTVSQCIEHFDPDRPVLYEDYFQSVCVRSMPGVEEAYVPQYVSADTLPAAELLPTLMSSAALPFGIFPERRTAGKRDSDGGTSDNCPIFPLIEFEGCTEIWVIALRPIQDTILWLRLQQSKFSKTKRLLALSKMPLEERYKLYYSRKRKNWEKAVPEPCCDSLPCRVEVIAPKTFLGGFFKGTLNFTRNRALELSEMGSRDASEKAADYLQSRSPGNSSVKNARPAEPPNTQSPPSPTGALLDQSL